MSTNWGANAVADFYLAWETSLPRDLSKGSDDRNKNNLLIRKDWMLLRIWKIFNDILMAIIV